MKNIKQYATTILLLCVLVLAIFAIASCDKNSGANNETTAAGETSSSTETTAAECSHESTEWVIDKGATCSEEGAKHKECALCKASLETAVIPTTAHTEEIVSGKAATCSEKGLTDGKKCSVCNAVLVEQTEIATISHTEEIIEGKAATCTEAGLTSGKKCSVCKTVLVKQEEIPALEHNEGDWIIDKNAEIGVEGAKHTECTRCQTVLKTETIPAITEAHSHEGSQWIVVTPPTCSQTGSKQFVCECGLVMETEVMDMVDHTEEILLGVSSTCISTGLTEGKKCSVCDKILVRQAVIAKTNHTEVPILSVSPTCTESGLTEGKKCSVCSTTTVSPMTVPPTGHSFQNGTCTGCGINEPYGLWIVDGQGYPVSDIVVKIMKDGEQIKMYPYNGKFLKLDVDQGTYQVVLDLSQSGESYVYDESLCVLTPQAKTATIRLFKQPTPTEEPLFVGYPISADYPAYRIEEGATSVTLTPNDYTFFIFAPTTSATYTVTYECSSELSIGYHGGTFFVQGSDLTDSSNDISRYENGISINVYSSNIGGEYVIAVKSTSATSCVINIKNAGDPGTRIEDTPWVPYLEDEDKVEEQLNISVEGEYSPIDLTDLSITAVYNESDGYYHLGSEDGAIIFIDLTSHSQYVSSIQTICGHQRMGAYIYDANGNVVEKRSYNELFIQYGMPDNADTPVDPPIRVPLTEKLAEAIQSFGDKNGWWKPDSETNIFTPVLLGAPYNQEYAWLLFCGYYS